MFSLDTLFYVLAVAGMCALGSSYRSRVTEGRRLLFRKVAAFVLLVPLGYLFLMVPFVGYYYDSSSKLAYPSELNALEPEGKYLKDHHARIEHLEDELKEAQQELKELRDHYRDILNLGFFAILLITIHITSARIKPEDEGS